MSDLPPAATGENLPQAEPPDKPAPETRAEMSGAGEQQNLASAPAAEPVAEPTNGSARDPFGVGSPPTHGESPEPVSESPRPGDEGSEELAPLQVDHVPSVCHVYPSEQLEFLTRVAVLTEVRGFTLDVSLPADTEVLDTDQPGGIEAPDFVVGDDMVFLRWRVGGPLEAGTELLFAVSIVTPDDKLLGPDPLGVSRHPVLISRARALPQVQGRVRGQPALEWAAVEVRTRARYLSYLPSVFERDALMSRFLMAFESFWAPLEQQVNTIDSYFDPGVMSLPMLHWLADRMDLEIDEEWDEDVKRRMMRNAVRLFRKRGTRDGLQELLEVYTGGEVSIVERRAENFKLGNETRLGSAVALGAANQPHTFAVRLRVPPVAATRPEMAQQLRDVRRLRIARLIDTERPAHVRYALEVEEM